MTISIWRYSHLTLAISSALFILIAAITGIILALEPISNKLKPYSTVNLKTISISETITGLQKEYDEIISIEIDENNFVSASVITKKGENKTFYINPKTGKEIGHIIDKSPIFEFATNLHRSLFLKSTGRFIIGFVSLLLFLIAITGIILISKRQGGILKFFSRIIKEEFHQYYHIIIGRYTLVPIIIITLTGVYLSLEKFSLLPKDKNQHQSLEINKTILKQNPSNFEVFKSISLDKVQKIEFPFSNDSEDYFFVKLTKKEVAIHQYNGQIISQKKQNLISLASHYSLILHTGKGSFIWSIILLLACFAILFFIFSGFSMTIKRLRKTTPLKNTISKDKAEYIILLGSETGSTLCYAKTFKNALLKANKTVFISELNNYSTYKNAKNIIIFTSTYGDGEAPSNAKNFIKLINTTKQNNTLFYSVLGFGSSNYPHFCKYAILVDASLQIHSNFIAITPLYKIDNQNTNSFKKWVYNWGKQHNISLEINEGKIQENIQLESTFKVIHVGKTNLDDTFLISLKPTRKKNFTSGDLLSITPKGEHKNRLYSIAKIDGKILLSVKKHKLGICSNYLNQLKENNFINATIQENKNFHFPNKAKEVILIANGTGIAPFLGMISENKNRKKIHLFLGQRTKKSTEIYSDYINDAYNKKLISSLHFAYSRENKEKIYVHNLIINKKDLIVKTLKNNGAILLCGSLAMQKDVEKVLDSIAKKYLSLSIEKLKENNQIKIDCY